MENIYLDAITEINPDAIVLTGFDDCIVGLCNTFEGSRLLYSEKKIIDKLSQDMTVEEAKEYYEFNILGGYLGTYTPIFLMDLDDY
jgi:hypothetical protein